MPTLFTESPAWDDKRVIERNERALARLAVTQGRGIRPADQLRPVAMHDLGKVSQQRVRDPVQKRRIRIEVGECLCLELQALATEVIVDKVKHGTLGGVGRVDRRKCSQDRLLIRIRGLVNKRFRVRPEISDVDGLQDLTYTYASTETEEKQRTYSSGTEYFTRTPSLRRRQRYL